MNIILFSIFKEDYMNFKDFFSQVFSYSQSKNHEFHLSKSQINEQNLDSENENNKEIKNIFNSIDVNIDYIKTKYNLLINSDIVIREFLLNAKGKQYKALLLYIDGMVDTQILNDFVLRPLILKNRSNTSDSNRVISEAVTNNITVRKVKKFNLPDFIISSLLPQNSINKVSTFEEAFMGVNSGDCALFIDTINVAFDIDVKGFKQRSIEKPSNETVIKGAQEAFVENIRTNTSMLRRLTNNENLIIENVNVGKITKTKCAICYMKNIVNLDLLAEVKYRINNLDVDSVLSAGQLEQLITLDNFLGLPKVISTERADNSVKNLLQGKIIIIINGSPYALILPAVFMDFLTSSEDTNLKPLYSNFLRIIRSIAAFLTLFLPGLYVAITSFHLEIFPTELLFSIIASRQNVPFPIIFEILIMELSFEIIREAGLRVPSPIGPTIGIVGALVLGQAAVSADIASPILIIIVAIAGISSLAIPDYTFGFHLRIYRFVFILLGYIAGILGIGIGIFIYLSEICDLESFGVSYTSPYAPLSNIKNNSFLLKPIWMRENRAEFLKTQKEKSQNHISMKWRNN